MIKRKCIVCGKTFYTYPSRVNGKNGHTSNYCSRKCYSVDRNKALIKSGNNTRFKIGHIPSNNRNMPTGKNHILWKGDNVGYRGLHYWLRRIKGVPVKCESCGRISTKPRVIQWANIDGEYRRNPDDYIALCASCHKKYDLRLKAIRD